MRILIIFIFLLSNSLASEVPDIKNIIIHKKPKSYDSITFLDAQKRIIKLSDYNGNLILLNFWATWCAPCKEEMPSLDFLKNQKDLNRLKIFPINVGKDDVKKSQFFFKELKIQNLKLYFDPPETLTKKLSLRGIPTSILFNKEGKEFARIIGSINFEDEKFVNWIKNYN